MEPMNSRRRRASLALLAAPVISAFSLLPTPAARAESTGVARVDLPAERLGVGDRMKIVLPESLPYPPGSADWKRISAREVA